MPRPTSSCSKLRFPPWGLRAGQCRSGGCDVHGQGPALLYQPTQRSTAVLPREGPAHSSPYSCWLKTNHSLPAGVNNHVPEHKPEWALQQFPEDFPCIIITLTQEIKPRYLNCPLAFFRTNIEKRKSQWLKKKKNQPTSQV